MKTYLSKASLSAIFAWALSLGSSFAQCEGTVVAINVTGGSFPAEISWALFSSNANAPVISGEAPMSTTACLEDGCYTLTMNDSFGDGWNGGMITIATSNGLVLLETTLVSGFSGSVAFGINTDDCQAATNWGCTDPLAWNFNPQADEDDGSCLYDNGGGGGNTSCNSSNCDGVCANFYLCTFSNGQNVGISIVSSTGDTVFFQSGFNNATIMYQNLCLQEGECYTVDMWNNAGQNGWYGGYWWLNLNGQTIVFNESLDNNLSFETTAFGIGASCPLDGCTDPLATNFNPNATDDDGSCTYPEPCSSNLVLINFSPGLFPQEISWMIVDENNTVVASGGGYNNNWAVTQSVCLPDGCYVLNMYDSFGDGWNGGILTIFGNGTVYLEATLPSGAYGQSGFGINAECQTEIEVYGCTDPSAFNYNPAATVDDGTCQYFYIPGCTDPEAINFNEMATFDDGSCIYDEVDCNLNEIISVFTPGQFANEVSWQIITETGQVWASGGPYMFNTQPLTQVLCLPDSCFTFEMFDSFGDGWEGSTLTLALNSGVTMTFTLPDGYYGSVNFTLDGTDCAGNDVVYGCTDPLALNYNPFATVNDGSCEYPDGDCTISFQVIPDNSGENTLWVVLEYSGSGNLEVLWDFGDGNFSWETFPSHVYENDGEYILCAFVYATNNNGMLECYDTFCDTISSDVFSGMMLDGKLSGNRQNGFTINVVPLSWLSISEQTITDIQIFPNPFGSDFQVVSPALRDGKVIIELFDANGRIVRAEELNNFESEVWRANVSELSQGLYVLSVRTDRGISRHRLLKQ